MHKLFFISILGFLIQNSFGQNVLVSNSMNPNEPSIALNPKDPDKMVAGSNLNFVYYSNDGGLTWTNNILTSSHGVWGDPTIVSDTAGNFYFFHLSNPSNGNWIDRIVCQKSIDNGQTWSDGSFTGLNGTKAQDKQWAVVDPITNNIYVTWTQFDNYGSSNSTDSSVILFSKSNDQGVTWSPAIRISPTAGDCEDSDNTVEGAVPAVGPNGEIYVSWAGPNGIVFNRSLDQGITWLNQEIPVDPMPGGWDFPIPTLSRCNGLPVTKCDLSGGAHHGTIYINWSDQRNGTDDTDVWLTKSTDGGNSWSSPIRINNDTTQTHQFLTWMDVDQVNGKLHFVYYDRRVGNLETEVYHAISLDGGNSFINVKISESPFVHVSGAFFGDYNNIVAYDDVVRPIWTRSENGYVSIWTNVTPLETILSASNNEALYDNNSIQQYPNPAINKTFLSFKLHELSTVNAKMYNQNGNLVHAVLVHEKLPYGKHTYPINLDELKLAPGSYSLSLTINDFTKTLRTIVVE